MAIIRTENITKIYNPDTIPVHALNGVTLDIEKAEFSAIVGPSGSGKTTLLNIIGGLDRPSSGKVWIDGKELSNMKENKLIKFRLNHIGFVFQAYNLIPVLTARENIEFVMLLQNVSKKERDKRTDELLEQIGLTDMANRRPNQLSGGQQQRVAVARALASKPSFILADEPTANLDSKSAKKLLDTMENLSIHENITFIFSTHDQRVIKRAYRVVRLVDGKIDSDIDQKVGSG